ncbi:MAG: hypothetical protein WCW77_03970 [Patescibacteria group bacterium]|jgi:hypothetical protein
MASIESSLTNRIINKSAEKPEEIEDDLAVGNKKAEWLLPHRGLKGINEALFTLLKTEEEPGGEKTNWKELHKKVKPFESALEMSANIREAIRCYIELKIPRLKEEIPRLAPLTDKELLDAITNNWFEGRIEEELSGQRGEILLMVLAQISRRMETTAYKNILEKASGEDLKKIGLDDAERKLAAKVLTVSQSANPLYIRFRAYAQLSPKPPARATGTGLYSPVDHKLHTIAELFPKETLSISQGFNSIAEDYEAWKDKSGAEIFRQYLVELSDYFLETDPKKALKMDESLDRSYERLLESGFPIIITSLRGGYNKEPYFDPELKISIATADLKEREESYSKARDAMAGSLGQIGAEKDKRQLRKAKIKNLISIGNYGVNLTFNYAGHESPIVVFLNDQIEIYDKDFPEFIERYINTGDSFSGLSDTEKRLLMEEISRTNTVFHELSHGIHPHAKAKHLKEETLDPAEEIKAEILYRALIPEIIKKGGLEGTARQWANGILATSLQYLKGETEKNPYFRAAVYSLNDHLAKGVIGIKDGKMEIKNYQEFYELYKEQAREILLIYENLKSGQAEANKLVTYRSEPNKELSEFIKILKGSEV